MGEMADKMAAAIAADGDPDAAAAPGTGNGDVPDAPAAADTPDSQRQGPPESIPYSRFQEVNTKYQELKAYEQLAELGIEPDSAVRLASFESSYVSDPKGTIGFLIDSQQDLSEEHKAALKALLSTEAPAGAQGDDLEAGDRTALPPDVQERLAYIDELRARDQREASDAQLQHVVRHWGDLDKQDDLEIPDRTKLVYIQAVAGRGGFETLEQLAEAARGMYLEDRDVQLRGAVQSRDTGTSRTVPGGAAVSSPPEKFADFGAANKQIMADIRAGRLPGVEE